MAGGRGILLLLVLAAGSAGLGLWIAGPGQQPPDPALPAIPAGGAGPAAALPELPAFEPPPLARFAEALERPLFSADRRPPADEPVPVVVEDRTLSATLHGITCDPRCVALLSAVGETAVVRVSNGDTFRGWIVQEIHPNSVDLERDGESATLELLYKTQAPVVPHRN